MQHIQLNAELEDWCTCRLSMLGVAKSQRCEVFHLIRGYILADASLNLSLVHPSIKIHESTIIFGSVENTFM